MGGIDTASFDSWSWVVQSVLNSCGPEPFTPCGWAVLSGKEKLSLRLTGYIGHKHLFAWIFVRGSDFSYLSNKSSKAMFIRAVDNPYVGLDLLGQNLFKNQVKNNFHGNILLAVL